MNTESRSQLRGYALAALLVIAAAGLTELLVPFNARITFSIFYAVVVVSTLYGGRRPGLLSIALSAAAAAYVFTPPAFSFRIGWVGLLQVSIFVAVSLLIWALTESRRRSEDELRRREAELTDFFENATVGLHWVGSDGKIIWANRAELELLGYTREEYIGRHISEFHDDQETIGDILRRLAGGEELHGYEARLRAKDGSVRHVAINSNVYWKDGEFVHTRCFTRDITERKREERTRSLLSAIVESSDDAILSSTLDGRIASWNVGAEKIFGYTSAEAIGQDVSFLAPPDRAEEAKRLFARFREDQSPVQYETVRVRKDGSLVDVAFSLSPIAGAAGEMLGVSAVARDITGRKRAEEALRFQAQLLDTVEQAVIATDARGTITYWNRFAEKLYGWEASEVVGRNIVEVISPDETREQSAEIMERIGAGESWVGEIELRRRDGTTFPALVTDTPVFGEGGAFVGVVGVSTDITERRRAESALAAQAAALRERSEVIEQAYDAIFLRDSSNAITFWNRGAERTYGFTKEDALGRSPHELLQTETPIPLEDIYASLRGEGYWEGEVTHMRKDGVRIVVDSRWATVKDERGEVASILEITRDVTERKRAEVELRRAAAIVENSDDAIISKDLEGTILSWNPGAERLYGYTAAETVGQPVTMLIPPDRPDEEPHILEQIRRGDPVDHYETVRRRKDGALIHVSLTVSPVRDASGRVVGASKIARDITARRRAEAELREQAEIIETVNRVGQTVAGELDLHKLVQTVTDAATELSDAHFGSFFYNVLDEHGASYTLYTLSGVPRSAFAHFPMPRATDLFGPTFRGEGTVCIDDVKRDPRYGKNSPYYGMPEGHLPVVSYLAVPVISRSGEVLGGLFFGHPEAGVFNDRKARIVEGLAAQAAVAMDNARLFEAVSRERANAKTSEEQYRFLAESIPQIVWTADASGESDYFNQRWYEYTGLSRDEQHARALVAHEVVHADDRPAVLEAWARASRTGEPYEVELRLRRGSDGSFRWHLARSLPLRDAEGRVAKWFGTSTDIDDRRRAEDAQRFLAEASEVLVSSLDYEMTLKRIAELVVPRLADWCAVDMVTDERTLRRLAVAHEDPAKIELAAEVERRYPQTLADREGVAKVIRTGEPEMYPNIPDELTALIARDAEHLKILRELGLRSAMIVPLIVQGRARGAITFVSAESGRHYAAGDLAFAQDLARRAALAVENARLYKEAQEVNRLKDEFLATLSHELRTPLTAVLGWTRLLGTGQLDEATRARALETIERNALSQVQLIDDILDVSRVIRGKLRLNVRSTDLVPVIEAAVDSVRPAAEAKGIRLQVILDRQSGPISGDPDRLQQVVWNLLSNAIKFTPKEGRVQVVLARVNSHLEVTVSDTGQGIPEEFLPYVFDRFRQADPTTTRTHGGLGLGLAIVRHLVELHGGSVKAESAGAGQGATFRVSLPLLAARRAEAAPPGESGEEARARVSTYFAGLDCPPELDGVRVLLVEDDADSRELLIMVLEHCRAEVVATAGSQEAMSALEGWRPDVIISDIEMPGEDGYTFIRRLRALPAERGGDTPAAALTAYARAEDRMRALVAGFQLHVPKPVEPAELVTVVASLAGRAIKS
ncbi:MAG TPA: PAS domain S-box protein [Pyrinomonadaceae bacterium]|jgi:PAS domain S-box-containing protein